MAQSIGGPFPTQIPEGDDPADIVRALRLYHYGSETIPSEPDDVPSGSMAGYIRDVLLAVNNQQIGATVVTPLQDTDNLNFSDAKTSGVYTRSFLLATNEESSELNYPTNSPGLLTYTKSASGEYFQTYLSVSDPGVSDNPGYFWRIGTKPQVSIVWGSWQKATPATHTHDDRYYTEQEINTRLNMGTVSANAVAIFDNNRQVTSASITSAQLQTLANVSSNIQGQLDLKAPTTHYHDDRYYLKSSVNNPQSGGQKTVRVFVQSNTPSGAQPGDVWLW